MIRSTSSIARFLLPSSSPCILFPRHLALPVGAKQATDQINYIKTATENEVVDWISIKNNILKIRGSLNEKNVDGVLLKVLINNKQFDTALSFAEHLKSAEELNLGSLNGILSLYYHLGLENNLSDKGKDFILDSYNSLYEKYNVLDSTTCEQLLHALCVIEEWKKALKVLDDIHLSSKPTHSAYSTLVATFFKLNKKTEALEMIQKSVNNRRPLQHIAYKEWIDYILRNYKDKKTILKYLDDICLHIAGNCVVVTEITAKKIIQTYSSLGWRANFTRINRQNGECNACKESLDCLILSDEEFHMLQQNIKDKLIVGSDLFLKTSPDELKRFLKFVEDTGPYDIVLDALNVAYALGKGHSGDRVRLLTYVVEYFSKQNKKILLIGRKHMLNWPKMRHLLKKTSNFITDNLSQDDPFFITAAILSGEHTDIVSKDLLRVHRFNLQDERLRVLFQRWQWQHQWMVFVARSGEPNIQRPLPVTPCAQRKSSGWHLPYEREDFSSAGQVRDGSPDWASWLCLAPDIDDQ